MNYIEKFKEEFGLVDHQSFLIKGKSDKYWFQGNSLYVKRSASFISQECETLTELLSGKCKIKPDLKCCDYQVGNCVIHPINGRGVIRKKEHWAGYMQYFIVFNNGYCNWYNLCELNSMEKIDSCNCKCYCCCRKK